MTKSTSTEKNGLKKGPWTPEEDQKLVDYIQKHGYGKWRILPKNAGLKRCGKSCRLRWANYLRPDIKRGRFSLEEEEAIIQLHSTLGNKWSTIAANLPGRTDNEIKNYWNTHIKKKLLKMGIDPVTHTPRLDILQLASILNSSLYNSPQNQINNSDLLGIQRVVNNPSQLQLLSLFTTLLSCQTRNQDVSISNNNNNYQQNQLCSNLLLQNQFQSSQPMQLDHSIQAFQSNQPHLSVQENNLESHIRKTKLVQQNQNSPVATPFSHQNSTLPNLWQSLLSDQEQPESSSAAMNNLLGSQMLCNNNEGMQNFNLSSMLLSPPSSSNPSALNSPSSSTFVNGTIEDERDTYNISNGLSDTLDFCD